MKYIIILILIVGGCIYGSSSAELGYRSRVDVGEQGTKRTNQTHKPKSLTENGRKGFSKSDTSRAESKRSTDNINSRNKLRISNGDSNNKPVYQTFLVTAYTKNDAGMNGRGITTNKTKAKMYRTVAASRGYKMGTVIYIPYFKKWPNKGKFIVEDRGGGILENDIDVFIDGPNAKEIAKQIGKRKLKGVILK